MGGVVSWVSGLFKKKPNVPVDLTPAAEILKVKTPQELIAEARKKLGMDVTKNFNFAVVGQSGVGKSSLINAFRQMRDSHPAAAAVGETETTTRITSYVHPQYAHIILWDIPGAGTLKQPEATYFDNNMLYAFDCILVLSADRFFAVDYEIAKKALQYKRPCAFVRTKADLSVKSIALRKAKSMREASKDLRLIVDESFQKGLSDAGFSPETTFQLFIVSGWALTKRTAYWLRDDETDELDRSLEKMDEDQLVVYISNSIRARLGDRGGGE